VPEVDCRVDRSGDERRLMWGGDRMDCGRGRKEVLGKTGMGKDRQL
jgi:hypothetical protein